MAKKINRDKLNKLKTANQHFDETYGKIGTETRQQFEFDTTIFLIGEMIKENRLKLELTQEELAEKTGLNRSYISKVEKGETDMRLSNFMKLLMGLNIDFFNLKEFKKELENQLAL